MKLLKRSTAWAIGSNRGSSFWVLSVKLLISYLSSMMIILCLSGIAVYRFVAHSLHQEIDQQLSTIASAARHNLSTIQAHPNQPQAKAPAEIDRDGDLDLPWQDLKIAAQTVEWFDAEGQMLARAGDPITTSPFTITAIPQFSQQQNVRNLTQPIFAEHDLKRQGYVRVSMTTAHVDKVLKQLARGMIWGGFGALLAIGVTGWWLTQRSLKPILRTMKMLRQFTADASHELRSPITAIQTAVEVMQSHPERVDPADLRKLSIIVNTTQHMKMLIENLLLLARSEDESQIIDLQDVIFLNEMIESVISLIQFRAISGRILLEFESSDPVWVKGNAIHLKRVFWNLLDNAVKFTPPEGIVNISLMPAQKTVAIVIQDTGIGIAPEHLPYIFARFWRADQSRCRSGGTGLGLSIVQSIILIHQGKISIESQLGLGTCIQVELPMYGYRRIDRNRA